MTHSNTKKQIHSTLDDHLKDAVCPRCKEKVDGPWESEFWDSFHYVTTQCGSCNYKLFYKADFISPGVEK